MKEEVSAGGVVYRRREGSLEVLICKHSGYHKWVLPKGHIEEGEQLEMTALREVKEEVGVKAVLGAQIGEPESYIFTLNGETISKKVYYFLMQYVSGNEQEHDLEMEEVKWVSFPDAIALMGYDGAKQVLRTAQTMLETI